VEEHLEWRHEAPRLLAAYQALWGGGVRLLAPRVHNRGRAGGGAIAHPPAHPGR
jgi:hypothetical protein